MKTKTIRYIWWFFRPTVNIDYIAKLKVYFVKAFMTVMLLNVIPVFHSHARTWFETFNDVELQGWKRISSVDEWRAKWEVVEGILFSQIRRPEFAAICRETDGDFMQWTARQFRLDTLTVIGSEIIFPPPGRDGRNGRGELGLFLGKRLQSPVFSAKGYFVSPEKINEGTYKEKEGFTRGKTISEYVNKFEFTTKNIKVVFNSGKFRVLTGSTLLTEFNDDTLPEIDVVGVLMTCHGEWFVGSISGFSVSGGDIPNHNLSLAVKLRNTQLTTTWAQLKHYK